MPEFLDISLISRKTITSNLEMEDCLRRLGLSEGENKSTLFEGKQIIVTCFEDKECDFEEVSIGIPDQIFTKKNFDSELEPITFFVNQCFQYNPHAEYALCSYELNGHLIGQVKKMQDFNNYEYLKRFPLVYIRRESMKLPCLQINIDAQDVFV